MTPCEAVSSPATMTAVTRPRGRPEDPGHSSQVQRTFHGKYNSFHVLCRSNYSGMQKREHSIKDDEEASLFSSQQKERGINLNYLLVICQL